ncbi:hypothetical protein Tco_1209197 [Tanacetum coccineum]
MDLETAQITTTAKLPTLKQGEYDMWRLRIEQYFQVQDYALWDVIENGNSFKPAAKTTTNVDGTSTTLIPGPVTTKEKVQKKNDMKARSMLLMTLPNEHLMTFNQYKNAKTLFVAIQKRFGGFKRFQPNRSQLVYEDLELIHEDDIEEIDLKWQLALLSIRIRRFFQKINRKITINGSDTAGYDNYMADDEVPTNMALMTFLDSEVHNDKTCSKTYLKSFETLKTQLDDLRIEFNKYEFNLATYKRGLASIEEQLVFYKKTEVIFCEQLAVLKRDISYKDSEISMLKGELEKLKQEKESNQLKIENFDNASKSLDKLIGSQITNKIRKGVGFLSYNVVPPPHTWLFSPLDLDLSYSSLEGFEQPEFEGYGPKTSKSVSEDISNEVRESPDAPLVDDNAQIIHVLGMCHGRK